MSDPVVRKTAEGSKGRFRSRLILFVVVPTLLLGASYFLFIEYIVLSQAGLGDGVRLALRVGGVVLIVLALISALTSGYLLADRLTRPVRMLLSLTETGDLPGGAGLFAHHRDWEVFQLYRRVHSLVRQNQAGAGALDELESLHRSLDQLKTTLDRTSQHGVPAPIRIEPGPLTEIADLLEAHRVRLTEFFSDIKSRAESLRQELDELSAADDEVFYRASQSIEEAHDRRLDEACAEIRRVGTVLALEVERLRDSSPEVGRLFDRFKDSADRMEEAVRASRALDLNQLPDPSGREELLQRLRQDLGSLERRLEEVEVK